MKKIMVVDDDPHICKAIKLALESEGFVVETAQSWPECSSKLKKGKPDLILLDILMPGTSGILILRSIRKTYPDVKVAMLTVVNKDSFAKQAKELGASDYIVKPFDNEELIRRVKRMLRG